MYWPWIIAIVILILMFKKRSSNGTSRDAVITNIFIALYLCLFIAIISFFIDSPNYSPQIIKITGIIGVFLSTIGLLQKVN